MSKNRETKTGIEELAESQLTKMVRAGLLKKERNGYSITLKGHMKLAEGTVKQ